MSKQLAFSAVHRHSLSVARISDSEGALFPGLMIRCPGDSFMVFSSSLSWFPIRKSNFPFSEQFPKSYKFPFGKKVFFSFFLCRKISTMKADWRDSSISSWSRCCQGSMDRALGRHLCICVGGWLACWNWAHRNPEESGTLHLPEVALTQWLTKAVV